MSIAAELLRLAQERVFALERQLESRAWDKCDPMKADLERRLAEARRVVADRIALSKGSL